MKKRNSLMISLLIILVVAIIAIFNNPVESRTVDLTFTWTAPGDDGNVGTASLYRIAYANSLAELSKLDTIIYEDTLQLVNDLVDPPIISDSVYIDTIIYPIGGTEIGVLPLPLISGTAQEYNALIDLPVGTWYFAIWARDEANNWAMRSNIKTVVIFDIESPAQITTFNLIENIP